MPLHSLSKASAHTEVASACTTLKLAIINEPWLRPSELAIGVVLFDCLLGTIVSLPRQCGSLSELSSRAFIALLWPEDYIPIKLSLAKCDGLSCLLGSGRYVGQNTIYTNTVQCITRCKLDDD